MNVNQRTGAALIGLGVFVLLGQLGLFRVIGEAVPLLIGVAFLAAYFILQQDWAIYPGGIMTGIGLGVLGVTLLPLTGFGHPAVMLTGIAGGFLLIWLLKRSEHWALWPASIVGLVAFAFWLATLNVMQPSAFRTVVSWALPLVLIGVGVTQLVRRR